MGGSIAVGISALSEDVAAAAIIPGDIPYLTATLLDRLALTFGASKGGLVVYPATPEGEQRNPVIWPRSAFGRLRKLKGREGGKSLLQEMAELCIAVPVADDGELQDIDEPVMRPRSAKSSLGSSFDNPNAAEAAARNRSQQQHEEAQGK